MNRYLRFLLVLGGGCALLGGTGFDHLARAQAGNGPTSLSGLKPAAGPMQVITLERALQLATERNYDLRIAAEQIVQARTMIRRAWSAFLPRLNAGGQYVYTTPVTEISFLDEQAAAGQRQQLESQALMMRTMADLSRITNPDNAVQLEQAAAALEQAAREIEPMDPIAIQPAHLFSGNVQLTVPLFNGGSIPMLQNTYDMVDQASLSLDRARQQALFAIASLYYSATTVKKMIEITENNEASAQSHLAATEARVAAGALPSIALKRAQFDLVKAEQTTRSTRSSYGMLLGTLGQMMGEDTMFELVAPREVDEVENLGNEDYFYTRAIEERRDLKGLRLAKQIAERGRIEYWMKFLPSLALVGQANWTSNTSGFSSEPLSYNAVVSASLPLYDGGLRYAARDEAESKIRAAELTIEKTESELAGLIRGNLQDIQVQEEGLASSRLAVELARDNHANARALFEVGAATYLEVIDASAAELAAEIDLARSELGIRISRLGLLFVVGAYPPIPELQR